MSLALVGRIAGVLCAALALATACGGHSVRTLGGDGAADDGSGDDSSSDDESGGFGGTGGSIAVGGAAFSGGTSNGGTGYGGVVTTGGLGGTGGTGGAAGSVSVGGTGPCGDCPPWEYGLAIEGDGPPFAMDFNNAIILGPGEVRCPEQPLRGGLGGCGYFELHACARPGGVAPCLDVDGGDARYFDRAGRFWSGIVTSLSQNPSIPGVSSGVFTLELSAEGNAVLLLTVDFSFCSGLILLEICR